MICVKKELERVYMISQKCEIVKCVSGISFLIIKILEFSQIYFMMILKIEFLGTEVLTSTIK